MVLVGVLVAVFGAGYNLLDTPVIDVGFLVTDPPTLADVEFLVRAEPTLEEARPLAVVVCEVTFETPFVVVTGVVVVVVFGPG